MEQVWRELVKCPRDGFIFAEACRVVSFVCLQLSRDVGDRALEAILVAFL